MTSSAARERQDLRLGWLWMSLFLHAGLIILVARARSSLSPAEPLASTLLVGTTFEVLVDEAGSIPVPAVAEPAAAPDSAAPDSAPPSRAAPVVAELSPQEPAVSQAATTPAIASPGLQTSSTPAGGSAEYGQEGKEGAPAQLRRVFIKMLPLAAKLDSTWLSLPAMSLGRGRFVLRLNEQGQLTSVEVRSGDAHPALVRAMQKNRTFLGMRRFASGQRDIVVDVSGQVSQSAPQMDAEDKVIALGVRVDPKDPQAEPKGAYFTYDNGQHVEFVWTAVQNRAHAQ